MILQLLGAGLSAWPPPAKFCAHGPAPPLLILEKESAVARHQTGHNSGVIHAGIYYAPGSLKARFCREGASATKAFCAEQGIKFENCGKLLVATNDREQAQMEALFERAKQNGIAAERIDAAGLRSLEPNITGTGALRVPSTGIVDYKVVAAAFAQIVGGERRRFAAWHRNHRHSRRPGRCRNFNRAANVARAIFDRMRGSAVRPACQIGRFENRSPHRAVSRRVLHLATIANGIDQPFDLSNSGPIAAICWDSPDADHRWKNYRRPQCGAWICPRRL